MWFENSASQTHFEKIMSAFLCLEIWDQEMRYVVKTLEFVMWNSQTA